MNTGGKMRTGGQLVVDGLRTNGIERAFCVPGESFLAILDALYDVPEIDLIVCRNEGGAAMMADAHGKLTGRPGICLSLAVQVPPTPAVVCISPPRIRPP